MVQIDNDSPVNPFGAGKLVISDLSDNEHTIRISMGNKTQFSIFDYLTVTAGDSTSLIDKNIIVDDKVMEFVGDWSEESPASDRPSDYSSSAYENTTHWTNSVGASMSYQFIGTLLHAIKL